MDDTDQDLDLFPVSQDGLLPQLPPASLSMAPMAPTSTASQDPQIQQRTLKRSVPIQLTSPYNAPTEFVQGAGGFGQSAALPNANMLGISLLLTSVGAAVGLTYAGAYGGVAGGLFGGALVNAIRAAKAVTQGTPDEDKEATVSATYAVVGAGIASYILYKFHSDKFKSNKLHTQEAKDNSNNDGLVGVK